MPPRGAAYLTQPGHPALSFPANVLNGFRTVSRARIRGRNRARSGAGSARYAADATRRTTRAASSLAQILSSRLAVRAERSSRANQGALHLRRRRARQDHADGFVLRREHAEAQAPRALS